MTGRGKLTAVLLIAATLATMIGSASLAEPDRDERDRPGKPEVRPRPDRDGPGRGRDMRRGREGRFHPEQIERMELMIGLIKRMQHICFDPATAGMIAIGGLKDEVRRKQEQIVADLEGQLAKTKTLGLRNAIRLTLKDLYKARGEDERVLDHLRKMVEENDAALSKDRSRRSK